MPREASSTSRTDTRPPGQGESVGQMSDLDMTGRTRSGRIYLAPQLARQTAPRSASFAQDPGYVIEGSSAEGCPPPPLVESPAQGIPPELELWSHEPQQ